MKKDQFRIRISSPPDREKLVAELLVGNDQWAELNQETDELLLEVYPRQDGLPWSLDFEATLEALNAAKKRLVGE